MKLRNLKPYMLVLLANIFFLSGCFSGFVGFRDLGDECYVGSTKSSSKNCRTYRTYQKKGYYEIFMNYWELKKYGYDDTKKDYTPYAKLIIEEELKKRKLCSKGFIIVKKYLAEGFNLSYEVTCVK